MSTPTECKGLMGWLFGHQFVKKSGGWVYELKVCYRCGLRP